MDPNQDDKAIEIRLKSFARPHMRAFHCSWWCFFVAFFIWFAIAPLLSEIRDDLGLSDSQVWTSNIVGVGGTVLMRFILGPLCDKYGARILFAVVLCVASIPTACTGLVHSSAGLSILRLFIGIAGGSFVMCQYWSSRMFSREVVGTANALCGGWGNLGGGVTQLVMGSALFPLFEWIYDGDSEKAWRTAPVVPAVVAFTSGIVVCLISDDAPKGNYKELKRHGHMHKVSATRCFRRGVANFNSWLLFVQYGCCFGVELTMNNTAALYFKDRFGQSTASAGAIASLFGWMNLFARGFGGYLSDHANSKWNGLQGRFRVQTVLLALEGAMVLVFATSQTLAGSIVIMVIFSLFVQAAEGSTYGIVPYVDPPSTGAISGIVGAGGNLGAVLFGLGFQQWGYRTGFFIMGFCILASSFLTILIDIPGQTRLFDFDKPVLSSSSRGATGQDPGEEQAQGGREQVRCDDAEGVKANNNKTYGTCRTGEVPTTETPLSVVPQKTSEVEREIHA